MKDLDSLPPACLGTPSAQLPTMLDGTSTALSIAPSAASSTFSPNNNANLHKDYVYTEGGNILHRRCVVKNDVSTEASCIVGSRTMLRGDVARISLGRHVVIEDGSVIRPPLRVIQGKVTAEPVPVMVGSYVHVGRRVVCEAVIVGHFVIVEGHSVIGPRAILGNGVWILEDSVVPPNAILSPFCVYKGNPVRCVGKLVHDAHPLLVRERTVQLYATLLSVVNPSRSSKAATSVATVAAAAGSDRKTPTNASVPQQDPSEGREAGRSETAAAAAAGGGGVVDADLDATPSGRSRIKDKGSSLS